MSAMKRWTLPSVNRSRVEAANRVGMLFRNTPYPAVDDPDRAAKVEALEKLFRAWQYLWETRYA